MGVVEVETLPEPPVALKTPPAKERPEPTEVVERREEPLPVRRVPDWKETHPVPPAGTEIGAKAPKLFSTKGVDGQKSPREVHKIPISQVIFYGVYALRIKPVGGTLVVIERPVKEYPLSSK